MPQRTNVFQEVVAIIHQHMAGDAVVEESELPAASGDGQQARLYVLPRTKVSGYEVIVSVEATATGRRADTKWVEALIQKHRNLPTSKLVLVSEAGFTPDAREEAEAEGAIPLAPEDLAADDPVQAVVNRLPSLWPKVIKLEPASADALVRKPDGSEQQVPNLLPDQSVFLSDGRLVGMFRDVLGTLYMANFPRLAQEMGLVDIAEDTERFFALWWDPCILNVEGEDQAVYIEQIEPHELHELRRAELRGKAIIHVAEIPLQHKKLGDVAFAYGQGQLGGQPALLVVSETQGGTAASIRLRQETENGS